MRKALDVSDEGTPAVLTVTPPDLNENTATPAGVLLPEFGVTRMDPVVTAFAMSAVWN
jgi:hypothetical protein